LDLSYEQKSYYLMTYSLKNKQIILLTNEQIRWIMVLRENETRF